ncbi:MAG: PASTA domain-containing protein [Bryobacteraceae bacterium]|nr:PASTA domain-containing protein [Bryobacteraceae bacterium]
MSRTIRVHSILLAALLLALAGCKKTPDLIGMTEKEARETLERKNLNAGQVTTAKRGETPGTVVDQDPKPGEKIPDDKTIALVLEAGGEVTPEPTGDPDEPQISTVPDLTGKTQADAETALTEAHLARGAIDVVVENHPEGTVFFQDPPAGTRVPAATLVNIKVASSGAAPVPNVVGDTQEAAQRKLVEAGLALGDVTPVIGVPGGIGRVVEQNPDAGVRVAKGQPVRVKVRQASARVPNVAGKHRKDAQIDLFTRELTPVITWLYNPRTLPAQEELVVSQSIAANTEVAKQTRVGISVRTRIKRSSIPEVVSRSGATRALTGPSVAEFLKKR